MKKIIIVIALILWGVFFYTQLRADDRKPYRFFEKKVEVEDAKFRWDWHLTLCKEQLRIDKVLNQRIMIELNGKNGAVRCPISQFWPGDNV